MNRLSTYVTAATLAVLSSLLTLPAHAQLLTFEGNGDVNPIGNFYNGGAGGNFGITFTNNPITLVSQDNGGIGNFTNEPSPFTDLDLANGDSTMNVSSGFTALSFFYSNKQGASMGIFSGLNGTGALLETINLPGNVTNLVYDVWTPLSTTFDGVAHSAVITVNQADDTGFDNILVTAAPEPGSLAFLGVALLPLLGRMRSRKA